MIKSTKGPSDDSDGGLVYLSKEKVKGPVQVWDLDPGTYEIKRLNVNIKDRWESWNQRAHSTPVHVSGKVNHKSSSSKPAAQPSKGSKVVEEPKTTESLALEAWNQICTDFGGAYDFKGNVELGVPLKFLVALQKVLPAHYTTYDVVQKLISPATEDEKCRFIDLYKRQNVGFPMLYISYSWSAKLADSLSYIIKYCEATAKANGEPVDLDNTFVWMDIFSSNLHNSNLQIDDLSRLRTAIGASQAVLLLVDEELRCLRRTWCLWEVHTCVTHGTPDKLKVLLYGVPPSRFNAEVTGLNLNTSSSTKDSHRAALIADLGGPGKSWRVVGKVKAAIVGAAKQQLAEVANLLSQPLKEVTSAVTVAKVSENLHWFSLVSAYLWQDHEVFEYERATLNRLSALKLFGLMHSVVTTYDPAVILAGLSATDFSHEHAYLIARHFLQAVTALSSPDSAAAHQNPYWPPVSECIKTVTRWAARDSTLPVDLQTALLG